MMTVLLSVERSVAGSHDGVASAESRFTNSQLAEASAA